MEREKRRRFKNQLTHSRYRRSQGWKLNKTCRLSNKKEGDGRGCQIVNLGGEPKQLVNRRTKEAARERQLTRSPDRLREDLSRGTRVRGKKGDLRGSKPEPWKEAFESSIAERKERGSQGASEKGGVSGSDERKNTSAFHSEEKGRRHATKVGGFFTDKEGVYKLRSRNKKKEGGVGEKSRHRCNGGWASVNKLQTFFSFQRSHKDASK